KYWSNLRNSGPRARTPRRPGSYPTYNFWVLLLRLFLHQPGIDTTTPAGKAMFQMMGVFAEFERAMIRERVKAGIARAKANGKHCGRPPIKPELAERIRKAMAVRGRPAFALLPSNSACRP